MATPASCSYEKAGSEESSLRYFARQPILNLGGDTFAYELLFRNGPNRDTVWDGDKATRTVLDTTVMFGLNKLTGGLPGFVNCTLESITSRVVEVLPPNLTVLEILETVEPTSELIAACHRLKFLGFRLALDDFVWKPELTPLVEIADYIKVDFLLSGPDERAELLKRVRGCPITFLAEKVETHEQFEQAKKEGFSLFQGYYFCRPTFVEKNDIPANKLVRLKLLRDLQKEKFDVKKTSRMVERDAAITFRLLRLANSPIYAFHEDVRSVETALFVLGERTFRRVVMLAIATTLNEDGPAEVLRIALMRARFCELGADLAGLEPTEQYLLGMFSLLPAMLRIPMERAIAGLPLRDKIRSALLGEKIPERSLLCWIEASEKLDWSSCCAIGKLGQIDDRSLVTFAGEAAEWADNTLMATR